MDTTTDIQKSCSVRQNLPKKTGADFTPFISKSFYIWDHFFPLLVPKDCKSLKKSLDIGLVFWSYIKVKKKKNYEKYNQFPPDPALVAWLANTNTVLKPFEINYS